MPVSIDLAILLKILSLIKSFISTRIPTVFELFFEEKNIALKSKKNITFSGKFFLVHERQLITYFGINATSNRAFVCFFLFYTRIEPI